jgi:hypothetical protein
MNENTRRGGSSLVSKIKHFFSISEKKTEEKEKGSRVKSTAQQKDEFSFTVEFVTDEEIVEISDKYDVQSLESVPQIARTATSSCNLRPMSTQAEQNLLFSSMDKVIGSDSVEHLEVGLLPLGLLCHTPAVEHEENFFNYNEFNLLHSGNHLCFNHLDKKRILEPDDPK